MVENKCPRMWEPFMGAGAGQVIEVSLSMIFLV